MTTTSPAGEPLSSPAEHPQKTVGEHFSGIFRGSGAPSAFGQVHDSEIASINVRRGGNPVAPFTSFGKPSATAPEDQEPVLDTVGLALSGGGVRSAAFSLGVLQALQVADVIKRIDYLSTVSGGGYIGCSMSVGMSLDNGKIPFPSEIRKDERPALQHIRDYSNYLIPHGIPDVISSIVIYLRGLAASFITVLPWLLLAASVTLYFSPTRASLVRPVLAESIFMGLFGAFPQQLEANPLLIPMSLLGVFGVALLLWAISRSRRSQSNAPEIPGFAPVLFSVSLVIVAVLFVCSAQTLVLDAMFAAAERRTAAHLSNGTASVLLIDWIRYIIIGLAPVAVATGLVGNKLLWFVKNATESSSLSTKAKGLVSGLAINLAALIVPLLIWVLYLQICFWVIADENLKYSSAPGWLVTAANALDEHAPWFMRANPANFPVLPPEGVRSTVAGLFLLLNYSWFVLVVVSLTLRGNANSLHRLYRDRLSKAFLIQPKDKLASRDEDIPTVDTFKLSALDEAKAPYHLINAALNIQASKNANRRGRNADFFMFSRNYIGSDTTGYVPTKIMEDRTKAIDLATAMAISGAAASSNMGTSSIRTWTASLALLNVRLGYWLRNPKLLLTPAIVPDELPIPYFIREMFGRLNENRKYVYVTDGGHVENLGVYELLRRRCCLIIIVDGEADPGMHFGSLVRLERYARIDLGIRLELPWQEIRTATLLASAEIEKRGDAGDLISKAGPHCAIGRIRYPGGEGRILYIKSSMTGDESGYVVDYKRRHGSFPHETTGDQFFTEEQFEVYRALGFHALQGVFSRNDRISVVREAKTAPAPLGPSAEPKKSPPPMGSVQDRDEAEQHALKEILSVLQPLPSSSLPIMTLSEPAVEIASPRA
jgi:hypothetical protein